MKNRLVFIIFVFMFIFAGLELFAFGKKQVEEESKPVNAEWALCITAFDTSALSPAWQTAGDTLARNLVASLQNMNYRLRGEEETGYYRDYAWTKSRTAALDAIVKKRNERDLLLFRGDPLWKYEKDLKTVDEAIIKLEEDLAKLETLAPEVEGKPVLVLSEKNRNGTFPLPPKPGAEYRFCTDEKVDAILSGSLSEYYGRIFLEMKMYTRYTNSFNYERSMLFSYDDFNGAVEEISGDLAAAVTETIPSAILVHSSPPEAMILIDGAFAGSSELDLRTRSPGTAQIDVIADNYVPVSFPLELAPGEVSELFISLTPLGRTAFEAVVPGKPGSRVFLGSLYVGETPLTLELPGAESTFISVETPDGEVGSVIFRNNVLVHGRAEFEEYNNNVRADFLTAPPLPGEEKPVENTRKNFYKAYGVFWLVLPAALLTAGIAGHYIAASNYVTSNNMYAYDKARREKIISNGSLASGIQVLSNGLIAVSLGTTFFQVYRYINASGGDSMPIVKEAKE